MLRSERRERNQRAAPEGPFPHPDKLRPVREKTPNSVARGIQRVLGGRFFFQTDANDPFVRLFCMGSVSVVGRYSV